MSNITFFIPLKDIEGEDISVGIQAVFTGNLEIKDNNFYNVRVGTNIALAESVQIENNQYGDVDIYHSQLSEDEIDWVKDKLKSGI